MSEDYYKLSGNLTLHGVTKPVTLDLVYRRTVNNPQTGQSSAGFQASGVIKRTDFGFAGKFSPPLLSNEVTFKASGEFAKAN